MDRKTLIKQFVPRQWRAYATETFAQYVVEEFLDGLDRPRASKS